MRMLGLVTPTVDDVDMLGIPWESQAETVEIWSMLVASGVRGKDPIYNS